MNTKIRRWGGRIVHSLAAEGLVKVGTLGKVKDHGERIAVSWEGCTTLVYDKDVASNFMAFGRQRGTPVMTMDRMMADHCLTIGSCNGPVNCACECHVCRPARSSRIESKWTVFYAIAAVRTKHAYKVRKNFVLIGKGRRRIKIGIHKTTGDGPATVKMISNHAHSIISMAESIE